MELRDLIAVIRKQLLMILLIPVIAVLVVIRLVSSQPVGFESATTFTINRTTSLNQSEVPFYLYDNYYAIQSSGFVADTVLAWFNSPAIIRDIYARANLAVHDDATPRSLISTFRARKIIPSNIELTTVQSDQQRGEQLIVAATQEIQERLTALSASSAQSGGAFTMLAEQPLTTLQPAKTIFLAIAAAAAGLIASLALAFLRHYLEK